MSVTPFSKNISKRPWLYDSTLVVFCCLTVLFGWWYPYFLNGWLPLSEAGCGLIWGDWISDVLFLVKKHIIPEWNPNFVLGVDYIGRDSFNNPLGLGNIFKFLFSDPKAEWIFGVFFYLSILSLGTYRFLVAYGINKKYAILGAALIVIYPKWMDDIYHGPGKFVTAYSVFPWILLTIKKMFETRPSLKSYILLGGLGGVCFLGSGAWVCMFTSYLIVPYYFYESFQFVKRLPPSQRKSGLVKIVGAPFFSILLMIGLSSYLLFPLLENVGLTDRSLYASPAGYGFFDLLGMFFPWSMRLYTMGYYDLAIPVPGTGVISNFRSYFGILAVPMLFYILTNSKLRKKYIFFGGWILATGFLFSQPANHFFPLMAKFEQLLGAQSSESFEFFGFIFCFNVISMAGISHIASTPAQANGTTQGAALKRLDKLLVFMLAGYMLILMGWLCCWFATHYFPGLFNTLLSFSFFDDLKRVIGIQLIFYSYFYDYFFYLFAAAFIVRMAILYTFKLELVTHRTYRERALFILIVADLLLFPKMFYPFTSSLDLRYSDSLVQNAFVKDEVGALDRIGASSILQKNALKVNNIINGVVEKNGSENVWDPMAMHGIVSGVNRDNGFFQPLFDPGLSYYAATIGKQTYNYHASLFPDYFYDFEHAMNKNNPFYYRSSWNAVYDPYSKLVDAAGIKYLFWHEQIKDPRLKLEKRFPVGDGYIYRNTKAVPKAYLVSKVEFFKDRSASLRRLEEKDFDLMESVVTEDGQLVDDFNSLAKTKMSFSGTLDIKQYSANKIIFDVVLNSPGILVITDLFFPYWHATVDSEPREIHRVNCAFRGVALDKGTHRVEMNYFNKPFHLGIKISFLSLIAFILLFVFSKKMPLIFKNHNNERLR